jgi:hypothetical protein
MKAEIKAAKMWAHPKAEMKDPIMAALAAESSDEGCLVMVSSRAHPFLVEYSSCILYA